LLVLIFLPFILFEGVIDGVARQLNLPPPPKPFTQLTYSQRSLPHRSVPSYSLHNEEIEELERDERGFIIRRTVRRKVGRN